MAKRDEQRERRLAEALRENLRRRKAQAREILPGTGREAMRSMAEGGERSEQEPPESATGEAGPLRQPSAGPPPRPGED